jgi:hypothetical protein
MLNDKPVAKKMVQTITIEIPEAQAASVAAGQ